ncbi:hypothetical protein J7M28_09905 [bacterium]|nr:hypothetical protein [bacterium]
MAVLALTRSTFAVFITLLTTFAAGSDTDKATGGKLPQHQAPVENTYAVQEKRQRKAYFKALEDVDRLLMGGDLAAAEATVIKWEPEFDGMWSLGEFGFRTRMKIGEAYRKRGNMDEALRLIESARPGGGCGYCMDCQAFQRGFQLAKMKRASGKFRSAFFHYIALPSLAISWETR